MQEYIVGTSNSIRRTFLRIRTVDDAAVQIPPRLAGPREPAQRVKGATYLHAEHVYYNVANLALIHADSSNRSRISLSFTYEVVKLQGYGGTR